MEGVLKPCPFCGGDAEVIQTWTVRFVTTVVTCRACGARGPSLASEESARSSWNTRQEEHEA